VSTPQTSVLGEADAEPPPVPGVAPLVKRLFVGIGLSALGSGLTMPFLYVYLAEVRGISTTTVGLLFAWMGLLGLVCSPVGGTMIDRFGPRPVMVVGLCTEALAQRRWRSCTTRSRRWWSRRSCAWAPSGCGRRAPRC
jgi:MFS family permease